MTPAHSGEMTTNPPLTVAVPTFNGARHLAEALRSVLSDPEARRELQIVTERPLVHRGRVARLPSDPDLDPLRHVRLPELGQGEIHALARGLAGKVLEFPRGLVPRPIGAGWSEHVLVRPVDALATSDEPALRRMLQKARRFA